MQTATALLHPDVRLTPAEPVSTPEKFRSGHHCHLELTPVWQYVIRKNRFPTNVDRQDVFAELTVRLQHPEWQVRLHGSRVLSYLIPAVGSQLDALMCPTILAALITNLAHFSPALRSSSMDAILIYVKYSSDREFILKSMIVQGLDVPGAKSSLTVNVMECVPVVLQQIVKKNRERPIAIPTFVHLVTALSNKMVQATFQQAAVYCLDRVKEIVGRNKFDHYLETFHPIIKKDFEVLCEVYRISSSSGQDSSVSSYDDENDVETPKTPRRVTFGGELIKIRSPDVSADEPEAITKVTTGIPIPVKPALSVPKHPNGEVNGKSTRSFAVSRQTKVRQSGGNSFYDRRTANQVRPNTLPPLRQSNFKQFSSAQIGPSLGTPIRRKLDDRTSFSKGYFSPHSILSTGRTNDSYDRNHKKSKNMKMDESTKNIESSVNLSRATFSVTVVPETVVRPEHNRQLQGLPPPPPDEWPGNGDRSRQPSSNTQRPGVTAIDGEDEEKSAMGEGHKQSPPNGSADNPTEIVPETRPIDPDDRPMPTQRTNDRKPPPSSSSSNSSLGAFVRPNNIQVYTAHVRSPNDKPVAEVKPTTATVQPLSTERRKSVGVYSKRQEKRPGEMRTNFTPFNEPQKALQLVSVQINSSEWEAAVTGLQNISRLSMFHGKELRSSSLQPYVRTVAKHIKSLRSQVARAACTAIQKMFSHVPKAVEPDIEEIALALFPRTADTNKFLRVQSAEALNAMVDNVNPVKCVQVITSKGIKHGNRMVRAEACRLLARLVDKLRVSGVLHLPTDARDSVITAATSMVLDNTPTSRQAAQHILARLSEDPRGAALISSAASPNVKATLNKSLSRIFLK